ncbi:putative NADH-cytochrome b5 reductase [Trypanosoma grayi]|uniref:putative NADH-cytochrome b5 reductase n=1 Tax=Trypanosoma grayi TaxID=71804 RepID=UPI0004F446B8|nr:putative NADH-cytochrome b5 reductase [Trypanosoma grayi]KEG12167.1 putative NADH-cytochrome b5 reductase [Trypanosoma grayi]
MRSFAAGTATALAVSSCFRSQFMADTQKRKVSAFSQTEYRPYKLLNVQTESHDTKIFSFGLPEKSMPVGLLPESCITLRYFDSKGEEVMRPYTPLNLATDKGSFDIVVKCYPNSKMGTYLHNMKKGTMIEAQGPWSVMEVKPSQYAHIGMLVGGTGVAPAYQVFRNILADPTNKTKFTLFYCNKAEKDILLRDRLEAIAREKPDHFTVCHMLAETPAGWTGYKGHITKDIIKEKMPSPDLKGNALVMVSGPPGFMKVVCGEKDGREQGPLGGFLKELGYSSEMVHKF